MENKKMEGLPNVGVLIYRPDPQEEFVSIPVNLLQTGEFTFYLDTEEGILCDVQFPSDILMIIEKKQAALIRLGETVAALQLNDPNLFQQWKERIPSSHLHSAIQFYQQYKKERNQEVYP